MPTAIDASVSRSSLFAWIIERWHRTRAGESSSGRLGHIDSLRALAALLVVWLHVSEVYLRLSPQVVAGAWVHDVASNIGVGRIGVVLFFAISGFVIPFSIRPDGPAPVRDFLLRRAFRILPLYWLSIPIGAFACHMIWGRSFPVRDMLLDTTLLQYVFGWPNAIGLYWTLALEVFFYAVCAGLLLLKSIDKYNRIGLLAVALVGSHLLVLLAYYRGLVGGAAYLTSLWYFHLGIMFWGTLYRAWSEQRLTSAFAKASMWGLLAFLVVVYPLFCGLVIKFPLFYYLGYSIAIAAFVLGTTAAKISWRPLVWMGEISYSIYLLHPIVFNFLLWILMQAEITSWWRTRHLAVYVIVNMVLTVALAALTYRYVERPAINFGRALARRWFGSTRTLVEVV